ncbi:cytochrome c oxidase assembly protein [Neiella marina]|uniref:Cytochrome c oxidase assembly protein CtaG n=1 Tax=Neiella holothuriorum TaxID=2870530 RepID=A0ABS7EG33_9GAMM|nr:cytochrome c oxidase assembly protein [Neiella holothuriorum]MBW8191235.1 cytochrome c oxidase assembly protein [Neiella holothuriorum]
MNTPTDRQTQHQQANKKLVGRLVLIVAAMFGFGFAMVPLYDVFCDITGLNGKTNSEAVSTVAVDADLSRQVRVQFVTHNAKGVAWPFQSSLPSIKVHPGVMTQVEFVVENPTNRPVIAQAIPSVSPGLGAQYLRKLECFCFNQQPLAPGERKVMPMQFYIAPDMPNDIGTLTLAYTLYDISNRGDQPANAQTAAP